MTITPDTAPVGLLGGTFDPIHYGHLRLAEEAREILGLSKIRFIPAGDPPHRGRPVVAAEQRLQMVRLAVSDNPSFDVDDVEIRSSDKSYTVLTLERLRAYYGEKRPLVLMLGADAFFAIPEWYQWHRLLELAHIAVASRPGFELGADRMPSSFSMQFEDIFRRNLKTTPEELADRPAGHIFTFEITPLTISATLIRDSFQTKRSVRYLLPDSVLDYIELHHLYH